MRSHLNKMNIYNEIKNKIDEVISHIKRENEQRNRHTEHDNDLITFDNEQSFFQKTIRMIKTGIYTLSSYSKNKTEMQDCIQHLNKIQKDVEVELNSFNKNAEWDTFTIAFYGETNAGKSTLIEALRIYFQEKTKMYSRNEFRAIANSSAESQERLRELSDGTIIGDGRSDYTHKTTSYAFNINNQDFQILDVPGIEGDESQVIDSIDSASKKAHCVFYITRSPTPPQKGDDGKEGTLEKIKKHLGKQSEVYSIFNKSINKPENLEQALISEGEKQSLRVLDEKMQEALGEHYVGRKDLCAKVAFLALAECLFNEKEREKFLNKYDSATLLQKSGFIEFADFVARDLVKNVQIKIKKSHYNKASKILKKLQISLAKFAVDSQKYLIEGKKEVDSAKKNLEYIKNACMQKVLNRVDENIDNFKKHARIKAYEFIDSDVSDDDFKQELEKIIKEQQEIFKNKLDLAIQQELKDFQEQVDDEVHNFKRRISYTIKDFKHLLAFNMKSGISIWGILGSLSGGIGIYITLTNFWNPAGWTAAAIMAVGIAIGLVKSVLKFFSTEYKKSEQKRATDENLQKISVSMSKTIKEELNKNAYKQIDKYIETVARECEKEIASMQRQYNLICQTINEVERLNYQIQGEMT